MTTNNQRAFYSYSGYLFFKEIHNINDTIYKISGTDVKPYAYLDMGKYQLPIKYRIELSADDYSKYGKNYYEGDAMGEDEKYIYFDVRNHVTTANRLNFRGFYMAFDKQTGIGFKFDYIIDDIHEGKNIVLHNISDDYYIGFREAYTLLLDGVYNGTESPQFKQLLSEINEDTNELIVLCRKKNMKRASN
jgi:hypothetical protein